MLLISWLPAHGNLPAHGLVLPPLIPVTAGIPAEIIYDNVAILDGVHSVEIECAIGTVGVNAWTFTATANDFGIYPFTMRLLNEANTVLAEAQTLLAVNPPKASQRDFRIMIIGDSLSNDGGYQNRLRNRMDTAGIQFSTVGTVSRGGMWVEAYGGNTYQRYLEGPPGFNSPFFYSNTGFDPNRYFTERTGGVRPTLYIIFLGINDTFAGSNSNPEGKETRINSMMTRAIAFIDGMRAAAPGSEVAIVLTPAGSRLQSAFDAYSATLGNDAQYYQDRWHDMRQRLVKRYIDVFGRREAEGIYLIPASIGMDRELSYPATDPIHPNTNGHNRIGDMLFSWINHYLNRESYSQWALNAFSSAELLNGAADKDRADAPGDLPLIARYWLNIPADQTTHQPLTWDQSGLNLTHRTGAPISLETSIDLVNWQAWSGTLETSNDEVNAYHHIPMQAMDKAQFPKRFWRISINASNN
jgi:lysophospholipase L1-like esterase